jgi:hypothetical protein
LVRRDGLGYNIGDISSPIWRFNVQVFFQFLYRCTCHQGWMFVEEIVGGDGSGCWGNGAFKEKEGMG